VTEKQGANIMKDRVTGARAQAGSGLGWRRTAGRWVSAKAQFPEFPFWNRYAHQDPRKPLFTVV
jgi:hypothetical protein